jgi:hypothetical protein
VSPANAGRAGDAPLASGWRMGLPEATTTRGKTDAGGGAYGEGIEPPRWMSSRCIAL